MDAGVRANLIGMWYMRGGRHPTMEMQQIRYFLALTRTLNFTRAAEECNVSQPALTRAIQALEAELGGDLIRREHSRSHLTELGKRMSPLLQRCYDSAVTAKSLAKAISRDDVVPLNVVISNSVNAETMMPCFSEMFRAFPGLQLKIFRAAAAEALAMLKDGAAEIAVAGPLDDSWERLDHWPLFSEPFSIAVRRDHPLARENAVTAEKLKSSALFVQAGSESHDEIARRLDEQGIASASLHEATTLHDVAALAGQGMGAALLPHSAPAGESIRKLPISDLALKRTVSVYAVAGRRREAAAAAFVNLLRNWRFDALEAASN
jgi:DNA-binding transcriptional LysR family regulator